jgi:hypothetical protein
MALWLDELLAVEFQVEGEEQPQRGTVNFIGGLGVTIAGEDSESEGTTTITFNSDASAPEAVNVSFDPDTSSLSSTNVQAAIDELSAVVDALTATDIDFTPTGSIAATNVQAAIAEVSGDVDGMVAADVAFTPTGTISSNDVQNAIAEVSGDVTALTAADIDFTPVGSIAATDVQAAIAEVSGDVTALTAADIDFTPVGSIAATNVQAAIAEVSGDVDGKTLTSVLTSGNTTSTKDIIVSSGDQILADSGTDRNIVGWDGTTIEYGDVNVATVIKGSTTLAYDSSVTVGSGISPSYHTNTTVATSSTTNIDYPLLDNLHYVLTYFITAKEQTAGTRWKAWGTISAYRDGGGAVLETTPAGHQPGFANTGTDMSIGTVAASGNNIRIPLTNADASHIQDVDVSIFEMFATADP